MSITVDISISETLVSDNKTSETSVASDDDVPEPEMLQRWAAASYAGEASAIASILVTSADEIQQLNKNYRHKDKATNVLSFPMQSPEDVDISLLGDVVLCASVINNEATQQAKSKAAHWAHMVVHGMLHLQGYDHLNQNEAEEMEQLEINILDQLGFPNPYLTA